MLRAFAQRVAVFVLAAACALTTPPPPAGTVPIHVEVHNMMARPAELTVRPPAGTVPGPPLPGAVQPASLPAGSTTDVTFWVPPAGRWWIFLQDSERRALRGGDRRACRCGMHDLHRVLRRRIGAVRVCRSHLGRNPDGESPEARRRDARMTLCCGPSPSASCCRSWPLLVRWSSHSRRHPVRSRRRIRNTLPDPVKLTITTRAGAVSGVIQPASLPALSVTVVTFHVPIAGDWIYMPSTAMTRSAAMS